VRLKKTLRPLDQPEDHHSAAKAQTEHQREFPGDIEQLVIGCGSLAVRTIQ